jgi:hypothetical protein
MSVVRGGRRLARLAGSAALILGVASAAAANAPAALAQVRSVLPVVNHHAAVSWGGNDAGELGNGTTTESALYGGVSGLGTGVVQVSAGTAHGLALLVSGLADVSQVSAGDSFSLAVYLPPLYR